MSGLVCAQENVTRTPNRQMTRETYVQEMQALNDTIQTKNREIVAMRGNIDKIKEDFNNAGQERIAEILATNANKILEHTIAIIDKRIAQLEKVIVNIQKYEKNADENETSDVNKDTIIERLNAKIDNLELLKSKLTPAPTPQELRQAINDVRQGEEEAITENRISALQTNILRLETILERYYKDTDDYDTYKTRIATLITQSKALTTTSTKEQITVVAKAYIQLKKDMIAKTTIKETEVEEWIKMHC